MSITIDRSKVAVEDVIARARSALIPLTGQFSYFCVMPVPEEDLRQYLHDPIAAVPPEIVRALPKIGIVLVPFLERANGQSGDLVTFERPPEPRYAFCSRVQTDDEALLLFAVKEEDTANYHYTLYRELSAIVAANWSPNAQEQYFRILREELSAEVHGEVDERSWHLKQGLLRRQSNVRRETKLFRDYASLSFQDTLTLYLHGLCCDIDVDTGPRQLPSRWLRKRLELLHSLFPPPEGYVVFPEQLRQR
jgi:hypothetical protein